MHCRALPAHLFFARKGAFRGNWRHATDHCRVVDGVGRDLGPFVGLAQSSAVTIGTTIFFTTHFMEQAENHYDRLAIMHTGRLVASVPRRSLEPPESARSSGYAGDDRSSSRTLLHLLADRRLHREDQGSIHGIGQVLSERAGEWLNRANAAQ